MIIAYIDNQNLYMATKTSDDPWTVDMKRFRIYLRDKYGVEKAYLFMGAYMQQLHDMYMRFQEYGYILVWKQHAEVLVGKKKGNVDTDVVFFMMYDTYEDPSFDGAVLVSGDGDYKRTVDHLKLKGKLKKVLLPSAKNASSLYKTLPESDKAFLDGSSVRRKIGLKK